MTCFIQNGSKLCSDDGEVIQIQPTPPRPMTGISGFELISECFEWKSDLFVQWLLTALHSSCIDDFG